MLQALVDSGEAKRRAAQARGHARRRPALHAGRARQARRRSTPSARASRPPRSSAARGARDARRCAGSSRTTSATPTPARSSRARCSPPTASRAYKTEPTTTTRGLERARSLSAHHDVARRRAARGRAVGGAPNAARDLQNAPPTRSRPSAPGRARRASSPASSVEVDGAARRSRRPGWAPSPAVAQRLATHEPRLIIVALRRRRTHRAAARPRRQGGHLRHRRHLDQARGEDARDEVRHVGRRRRARGRRRDRRGSSCRCASLAVDRRDREHAVSGHAIKPGDIVRAHDRHDDRGQQHRRRGPARAGRLPRATRSTQGAERIVDLATLTGAHRHRARHDLRRASSPPTTRWPTRSPRRARRAGELVWRMPLHPEYDELIEGPLRRPRQLRRGRKAPPIHGAEFLQRFAGDVPWAHLDIAGTGLRQRQAPTRPRAAPGWGVRLLVELARAQARTCGEGDSAAGATARRRRGSVPRAAVSAASKSTSCARSYSACACEGSSPTAVSPTRPSS